MPLLSLRTGVEIFYESHGEGAPLVLIMGTSADHTYWGFQLPAYAKRFRTIVFDSRGTGQSSTPADPTTCTSAVLAEDVKALLEELAIDRAHVSGLSLGAAVVQELAIRYPSTVATAQMHGSWAAPDPAFVYAIETMKYPLLLGDYAGFVKTAFAWILTADFVNDPARCEPMMKAVLESAHPPTIAGILGHINADLKHDTLARLGTIRCPTLITAGQHDIQVPPRLGRAVHRAIPGSVYHEFEGPGASHLSCVERATEFNELTLAWLQSTR